jgi:hypothetical protein
VGPVQNPKDAEYQDHAKGHSHIDTALDQSVNPNSDRGHTFPFLLLGIFSRP